MERVPPLVADVVRSKPEVIVTAANALIAEVAKATSSIPIVMAAGSDPVEWGLAQSLARPGGNVTGVTGFYESTPIKMLELVTALVGRGARVEAMVESNTPFSRPRYRNEIAATAKTLDLHWKFVDVSTPEDVARAMESLVRSPPSALVVLPGPMMFALGSDLVRRADNLSIPTIYPFEEMAEAGGLASYAVDLADNYRRAAAYVDRILRGAAAGELPIEQPTRLWLTLNLGTAKRLGIRIPRDVLAQADRIIE